MSTHRRKPSEDMYEKAEGEEKKMPSRKSYVPGVVDKLRYARFHVHTTTTGGVLLLGVTADYNLLISANLRAACRYRHGRKRLSSPGAGVLRGVKFKAETQHG